MMASPLILRITSKFDSSGVKDAKAGFNDLTSSVHRANTGVQGVSKSFEEMTAALAGVRLIGPKVAQPLMEGFNLFHGTVYKIISTLKLFRKTVFVGSLLAAPLIIAAKHALELDAALQPLITRLGQLGQAGEFEGRRLRAFAEQIQRNTGTSAKDVIRSLDVLVAKTRSAADAEQVITAAQKIHQATGAKLVDVTKALASAYAGNSSELAALTGHTQQEINALLKSGELVRKLDADFALAAERGASSFAGVLASIPGKLALIFSDATKFAARNISFKFIGDFANGADRARSKVGELQDLLDTVLFNRKSPDLRTFEEIQIAAGKTADEVKRLQSILGDKTANISPREREDLQSILSVRLQEQGILEAQVARERELSSAIRERLSAAAALVSLQTALLREQERPRAGGESAQAFNEAKKRIREQIDLQREAQIRLEAIEEARQIFAKRGAVTEEERADIVSRAENKIVQAKLDSLAKERSIENERVGNINKVKEAQLALQRFQAESRRGRFEGSSDADVEEFQQQAAKKQVELAVLNAQKERDAILAQRQLTAEEALRIETELSLKVEQIRETEAQRRAKREIELSKLTADQRKKIDDDAAKARNLVEQFREGPRKPQVQVEFEIDTEAALKKVRADLDTSAEKSKLQQDLTNLLTPQQIEVGNIIAALESSLKEKKLSLNLNLLQDRAQQQELATNLGELISTSVIAALRRRLTPLGVIQEIVKGAAEGGSES